MERRDFLTRTALGAAATVAPSYEVAAADNSPNSESGWPQRKRPESSPLWTWTTVELAEAIRSGRVSSREAVQSCVQRMHVVNPVVNAIAESLETEALVAADLADRERMRRSRHELPPLFGVPITTKMDSDVKGHASTDGVVAFKDNIATEDRAPIASLRAAGAIIIGRTNVPAFTFRWFTDNDLHGRTFNPWDPTLTPGGSSGGAACAVAVGIGPLAHGNDIAGSVRYPAYACGVAGIRPSLGVVSNFNPSAIGTPKPITSQIMAVQGLMARSVADLRLGLPAMSGRDVRDPWWQPTPPPPKGSRARPKAALMSRLDGYTAEPAVAAGLANAARALMAAGYDVEEAAPPFFKEIAELWSPLVLTEARFGFAQAIELFGDEKVKTAMRTWLAITPALDMEHYSAGFNRRYVILREWRLFLQKYTVLVTPSAWTKPFPIDYDQRGPDVFRQILRSVSPQLAVALLGLPGLSVPTGLVGGVPTGVQVVADRFREDLCFDAGESIEEGIDMGTPIDPRSARRA